MNATDTGAALMRAILSAPADDAPRLIYADWLDECAGERGEPLPRPRAEFIRVQCELAAITNFGEPSCMCFAGEIVNQSLHENWCPLGIYKSTVSSLIGRERAIINSIPQRDFTWRWGIGGDFRHTVKADAGSTLPPFHERPDCCALYTRGFVSDVNCNAGLWLQCADRIREKCPVTRVRITTPVPIHTKTAQDLAAPRGWSCGYSIRPNQRRTPWNYHALGCPQININDDAALAKVLLEAEFPGITFTVDYRT